MTNGEADGPMPTPSSRDDTGKGSAALNVLNALNALNVSPGSAPASARSTSPPMSAHAALAALWRDAGLPTPALDHVDLPGAEPVLPSSFAVGTAAQASLAAAALAAAELWQQRSGGPRQRVGVEMRHAAVECRGWFSLDGRVPDPWDKLSGLYACRDGGWLRLHANFAHHRDGALRLLGLPPGPETPRAAVAEALRGASAEAVEQAAADAGLVVAAARSFEAWDRHPQAVATRDLPTVRIEKIPGTERHPPRPRPALASGAPPLHGLRVLDLTRILAGPVAGRALAAYGADVMLVNSPALPNIESIADTSRGKLSTHIDLRDPAGTAALTALLGEADVFLQAYRPGALDRLGFGADDAARIRPGIVHVSLGAYGHVGPWAERRGFDSLVQTATGFNLAEAVAAGRAEPLALPVQILDYAAGHLLAFGAQAALWRQTREGGSWQVRVSLAGTGRWLRGLGRVDEGFAVEKPAVEPYCQAVDSGYGRLVGVRHAARFSATPLAPVRPSMPPGTHPPVWP